MEGLGGRLKLRAAELGLSDAEVARRAGLTATRYGHYVNDYREPDLATLVRVCRVLGVRPDELLAFETEIADDEAMATRKKLAGLAATMSGPTLAVAIEVMHALAARPVPQADGGEKPDRIRRSRPRLPR